MKDIQECFSILGSGEVEEEEEVYKYAIVITFENVSTFANVYFVMLPVLQEVM